MSAYIDTETEFQDADCLFEALEEEFGQGCVQRHSQAVHLEGYEGRKRKEVAHLVIKRQHVGGAANDVGFEIRGKRIIAHISEHDQSCNFTEARQKQVKRLYAKRVTYKHARKHGYKVTEMPSGNGKIKLRLIKY